MFISDRFVFVELQKTGCSHIRVLLSQLIEGELVGKHNRPAPDLLKSSRTFLGSVRNPWDWYVSLWSYGCKPYGELYNQVTAPRSKQFPDLKGRYWRYSPFNAALSMWYELFRNPETWQQCYADASDPTCFRTWLHLIYSHQSSLDIRERYFYSFTKHSAGLLTYRYLYLFCRNHNALYSDRRLRSFEHLKDFAVQDTYIDYFIRNESLESDLIDILSRCGVSISDTQKKEVLGLEKTNVSNRKRDLSYYYDSESIELVRQREKLIIEKFGYAPPRY